MSTFYNFQDPFLHNGYSQAGPPVTVSQKLKFLDQRKGEKNGKVIYNCLFYLFAKAQQTEGVSDI